MGAIVTVVDRSADVREGHTILADVAVAVNPEDERYKELIEAMYE